MQWLLVPSPLSKLASHAGPIKGPSSQTRLTKNILPFVQGASIDPRHLDTYLAWESSVISQVGERLVLYNSENVPFFLFRTARLNFFPNNYWYISSCLTCDLTTDFFNCALISVTFYRSSAPTWQHNIGPHVWE